MATITPERTDLAQFHMTNSLVAEARRNDQISLMRGENPDPRGMFPGTKVLLENLNRQIPNRIYTSPEGIVARVLFFSEKELPYQLRIDILQLGSQARVMKSEVYIAAKPSYLEKEIEFWRARFGMSGDLLINPATVMVNAAGELINIGGSSENSVYCHYDHTVLNGPRIIGLDLIRGSDRKFEDHQHLAEVPDFLVAYSKPFDNFPTHSHSIVAGGLLVMS